MRSSRIQMRVVAALSLTLWMIPVGSDVTCSAQNSFINSPNPVLKYSGGTGAVDDPFRICTAADLEQLSAAPGHWGLFFKLMDDVDLKSKKLTPIGSSLTPFTGSFNGAYHRIKNLVVYDDGSTAGGTGLFGVVRGATAVLSALILENPTIIGNSADDVGALVGRLEGATVRQVGVKGGRLFGAAGRDSRVGGLAGTNVGGFILECFSTATVEGVSACGGLVGNNEENGTVQDCYTAGRVVMRPLCPLDQPYRCGGLLALNRGRVSFCYADSPVTVLTSGVCAGYSGGFIGAAIMAPYPGVSWVLFCFCDADGLAAIGGSGTSFEDVSAVPHAALTQRATFSHWDFEMIWSLRPNATPRLRWENPQGGDDCAP